MPPSRRCQRSLCQPTRNLWSPVCGSAACGARCAGPDRAPAIVIFRLKRPLHVTWRPIFRKVDFKPKWQTSHIRWSFQQRAVAAACVPGALWAVQLRPQATFCAHAVSDQSELTNFSIAVASTGGPPSDAQSMPCLDSAAQIALSRASWAALWSSSLWIACTSGSSRSAEMP